MTERIAFLSEHASPLAALGGEDAGGQNVYVAQVTRNLARIGYAVDVFVRGDGSQEQVVQWLPGVRVVHLHVGPPHFLLKDDLWPLMPAFRDAFLDFVQKTGTRYRLIHSNFWMSGWVAGRLKEQLEIPVAHIFHATGVTKRRHQGDADTSPEERIAIEKGIVRDVDRILAQCPAEVEELVGEYGARADKIRVTPPGVDLERFRPLARSEARQRLGLDPEAFILVYVGRMVRRKGVANVIRALPDLIEEAPAGRDLYFLVVGGDGQEPDPERTPEIGRLQRLAEELGVQEHVIFSGARPPSELYQYYSAGDVAVTTPWYEPFGLTPLEAMACGRPVIGARVGGIKFSVVDGETGLLVPPRQPRPLAQALLRFVKDESLSRRMGELARVRMENEFSWPRVAQRVAGVYQNLLADELMRHRRPARQPVMEAIYGAD